MAIDLGEQSGIDPEMIGEELNAIGKASLQIAERNAGVLAAVADVQETISLESASIAVHVHTSPAPGPWRT
jgi:hypothetical protein